MQILRVVQLSRFYCPLCNCVMSAVGDNRVACRSDGCKLAGVKYELPVTDLMKSSDQGEPPPTALEAFAKAGDELHAVATRTGEAADMLERIRPERKQRATPR